MALKKDTDDKASRAAAGRGAWHLLAGNRDLVAELIAERRAAHVSEESAAAQHDRDIDKPLGRRGTE